MKIAVLSDIHGNLDALQSVIIDIENQKADRIYICGDLAMAGPEPVETIDYIFDLRQRKDITIIQGNTDEMIVYSTGELGDKHTPPNKIMSQALKYAQKSLRADQKEFLLELPVQHFEDIGKLSFLFVHGSVRKNNEDISPGLPTDKVKELINNASEDIIFCGHTHLPVIYHVDKQTVVNVGSVGRPFTDKPEACYAILDYPDLNDTKFSVYHRRVPYDFESAAKKLSSQNFEGSDKLAQMLIKATSRYPE